MCQHRTEKLKTSVGHSTKTGHLNIFIDIKTNAVCLICQESVAIFKEFNLKQHFQTKHENFGINLNETELWRKANDLVRSLKLEQTIFAKPSKQHVALQTILIFKWPSVQKRLPIP